MAAYVGNSTETFVGFLDLTGLTKKVDFGPLVATFEDSTTHADGGYQCWLPGLKSGVAKIMGNQDWAADVLDDDMSIGQLGTQYPISVFPKPTNVAAAAGDPALIARGLLSTLNPLGEGTVGKIAGVDMTLPFDTAFGSRALVGHPKAARTANGNGTAVALAGPTAAQRLYATLHVTAYSGFTNVVVKVQSDNSSGMASPTDRITFATVTGRTSEFASVAGDFSTETHLRVTWTVTGSGSITFAVAFGVA
jgi:hypothetical protein